MSGRALLIEHDGRCQSLAEWARELGMRPHALRQRLLRGWPLDRALTTPPLAKGQRHRGDGRLSAEDVQLVRALKADRTRLEVERLQLLRQQAMATRRLRSLARQIWQVSDERIAERFDVSMQTVHAVTVPDGDGYEADLRRQQSRARR